MRFNVSLIVFVCGLSLMERGETAETIYRSHPPLRKAPLPADRAMGKGPAYFVDTAKGDDANNGSETKPWKTVGHAVTHLKAGDTLYLRGGTYHENAVVRLVGRADAPITIRSYPKEQAILDGGIGAFFDAPADVWEPYAKGGPDEYRSKKSYPNLRHVVASFGDSMVGLQSYYHVKDLRAESEFVEREPDKSDVKPLYCGPGLWYDRETGHLHARLSPTTLPGFDNYKGETDPRKLPLVVAPFRSVPLHVDGGEHLRFQDLVIRGGGFETVALDQARDVEFDNVTVWCGTNGIRATGTRQLKLYRSALHGNVAPWSSRFESGFNTYPGRTERDITRMNTHALLTSDANREFSVYAYPFNDDWDIGHCEFTDAHDGLYLGGVNVRFHHNVVWNLHDDGIYLSPMYPRHTYLKGGAKLHLYQNLFGRCLTTLAFGGPESTQDTVYLYRNVFDLREPVPTSRPTGRDQKAATGTGKVMGDHGSPPWSAMNLYHNTFVIRTPSRTADMSLTGAATAERPRRLFNNILLHGERLPRYQAPDPEKAHADGNLFWQPGLDAKQAEGYFKTYRASPAFAAGKKFYASGLDAGSLAADPKLIAFDLDPKTANDYRLREGSPAVDAGVELPAEWPDPLRKADKGKPDVGALPLGAEPFRAGRESAPPVR